VSGKESRPGLDSFQFAHETTLVNPAGEAGFTICTRNGKSHSPIGTTLIKKGRKRTFFNGLARGTEFKVRVSIKPTYVNKMKTTFLLFFFLMVASAVVFVMNSIISATTVEKQKIY
jgi:hypothetical protein